MHWEMRMVYCTIKLKIKLIQIKQSNWNGIIMELHLWKGRSVWNLTHRCRHLCWISGRLPVGEVDATSGMTATSALKCTRRMAIDLMWITVVSNSDDAFFSVQPPHIPSQDENEWGKNKTSKRHQSIAVWNSIRHSADSERTQVPLFQNELDSSICG